MSFQSKLGLNVMLLVTENLWLRKYCQNINYILTRRARVCGRYIFNSQQSISFSFRWILWGVLAGIFSLIAVQSLTRQFRSSEV